MSYCFICKLQCKTIFWKKKETELTTSKLKSSYLEIIGIVSKRADKIVSCIIVFLWLIKTVFVYSLEVSVLSWTVVRWNRIICLLRLIYFVFERLVDIHSVNLDGWIYITKCFRASTYLLVGLTWSFPWLICTKQLVHIVRLFLLALNK